MTKRICAFLAIIVLILPHVVLADDIEEEADDFEAIQEEIMQTVAEPTKEPTINSRAAIVIDRESKRVLYGKNINEKRAMASTTKIMTCLIALENSRLDETVTVSKKAAGVGGSRLGLSTGDKITMNDLLYGLMLRSGNDAAAQIAETIGGDYEGFAKMMNKKAKELELNNTNFVTPHGLDNNQHYTTAYELAVLTDYALNNKKFAEIVSKKTKTILINGVQRELYNTNELLGVLNGVNGVKTGFTNNAGRCLVTSCSRNGINVISVVLGADTKKFRTKDSIQILEYAFNNYTKINLKEKVTNAFKAWVEQNDIKIIKGKEDSVKPVMEELLYESYLVKKGEEENIDIVLECKDVLEAPLEQWQHVGCVKINVAKEEIMELKLLLPRSINKKEAIDYWNELWLNVKNIEVRNYKMRAARFEVTDVFFIALL